MGKIYEKPQLEIIKINGEDFLTMSRDIDENQGSWVMAKDIGYNQGTWTSSNSN